MTDHVLIIVLCILNMIALLICLWALGKILDKLTCLNDRIIRLYKILDSNISDIEKRTYETKLTVNAIDKRLCKKETKKKKRRTEKNNP